MGRQWLPIRIDFIIQYWVGVKGVINERDEISVKKHILMSKNTFL